MSEPALWPLPLGAVVTPVNWWLPVEIGPAESAVATFSQAADAAPARFESACLVSQAGVKLEELVLLLPLAVVRKLKKAIAQALATASVTLGPTTVVLLV